MSVTNIRGLFSIEALIDSMSNTLLGHKNFKDVSVYKLLTFYRVGPTPIPVDAAAMKRFEKAAIRFRAVKIDQVSGCFTR